MCSQTTIQAAARPYASDNVDDVDEPEEDHVCLVMKVALVRNTICGTPREA
jgi:hypothetical protein